MEDEDIRKGVIIIKPKTDFEENPKKWAKETLSFLEDVLSEGEK